MYKLKTSKVSTWGLNGTSFVLHVHNWLVRFINASNDNMLAINYSISSFRWTYDPQRKIILCFLFPTSYINKKTMGITNQMSDRGKHLFLPFLLFYLDTKVVSGSSTPNTNLKIATFSCLPEGSEHNLWKQNI